jgi:hypothetical protein
MNATIALLVAIVAFIYHELVYVHTKIYRHIYTHIWEKLSLFCSLSNQTSHTHQSHLTVSITALLHAHTLTDDGMHVVLLQVDPNMIKIWETASHYHLVHAAALLGTAVPCLHMREMRHCVRDNGACLCSAPGKYLIAIHKT